MPFSGPNDSKLPSNVADKPQSVRARYVRVWNGTFASCQRENGSRQECETLAFQVANAQLKELGPYGWSNNAAELEELGTFGWNTNEAQLKELGGYLWNNSTAQLKEFGIAVPNFRAATWSSPYRNEKGQGA